MTTIQPDLCPDCDNVHSGKCTVGPRRGSLGSSEVVIPCEVVTELEEVRTAEPRPVPPGEIYLDDRGREWIRLDEGGEWLPYSGTFEETVQFTMKGQALNYPSKLRDGKPVPLSNIELHEYQINPPRPRRRTSSIWG